MLYMLYMLFMLDTLFSSGAQTVDLFVLSFNIIVGIVSIWIIFLLDSSSG